MKYNLLIAFLVSILLFVTGCNNRNFVEDIYYYVKKGNSEEMLTAFIVLSNISLSKSEISFIEKDYRNEKDKKKQYYYEFLLCKRTQEEKYIRSFIKNSKKNTSVLVENKSYWVSISNPIYKQLAYYAKTDDEALAILFQLTQISDGAILSVITEDLSEIYKTTPERFSSISQQTGIQEKNVLTLMEDE